jgi:hypothetical protein
MLIWETMQSIVVFDNKIHEVARTLYSLEGRTIQGISYYTVWNSSFKNNKTEEFVFINESFTSKRSFEAIAS